MWEMRHGSGKTDQMSESKPFGTEIWRKLVVSGRARSKTRRSSPHAYPDHPSVRGFGIRRDLSSPKGIGKLQYYPE